MKFSVIYCYSNHWKKKKIPPGATLTSIEVMPGLKLDCEVVSPSVVRAAKPSFHVCWVSDFESWETYFFGVESACPERCLLLLLPTPGGGRHSAVCSTSCQRNFCRCLPLRGAVFGLGEVVISCKKHLHPSGWNRLLIAKRGLCETIFTVK